MAISDTLPFLCVFSRSVNTWYLFSFLCIAEVVFILNRFSFPLPKEQSLTWHLRLLLLYLLFCDFSRKNMIQELLQSPHYGSDFVLL